MDEWCFLIALIFGVSGSGEVEQQLSWDPANISYLPRLTPETMAFSGCSITSGVGKGLVVDTGMSTRIL